MAIRKTKTVSLQPDILNLAMKKCKDNNLYFSQYITRLIMQDNNYFGTFKNK